MVSDVRDGTSCEVKIFPLEKMHCDPRMVYWHAAPLGITGLGVEYIIGDGSKITVR